MSNETNVNERSVAAAGSAVPPLMVAFDIPDRMPADIQMMAVWSQAWSQFASRCQPHEKIAALSWFGAWTKAQMEKNP